MRTLQIIMSALLVVMFLVACGPAPVQSPAPAPQAPAAAPAAPAAPVPKAVARPAWQEKWDQTLADARKEGTVVMTTAMAGSVGDAISRGFKKDYGIRFEFIAGKGADIVAKVLAERRAGLFNYDVYLGGTTNMYAGLKPGGAMDSIEPALILPDVTDPEVISKTWYQKKLPWVDADRYMLSPSPVVVFSVGVNTNLVKEGEIKSYRDLLNPKWQEKFVLDDPTGTGIGNTFIVFAQSVLGQDFLVQLANAKPIILRDQNLEADWLVHGKIAVLVVPRIDLLAELMRLGAPVKGIIPAEGTFLHGGSGVLGIFNRPPHPSAAKVFMNWYLSKEGQTVAVRASGYQSGRVDVPTDHLLPEQIRKPDGKYFVTDDEKVIEAKAAQLKKSLELFGPLIKK